MQSPLDWDPGALKSTIHQERFVAYPAIGHGASRRWVANQNVLGLYLNGQLRHSCLVAINAAPKDRRESHEQFFFRPYVSVAFWGLEGCIESTAVVKLGTFCPRLVLGRQTRQL